MATVWVNGQAVQMKDGEKLNAIEAAQRVGVEVPHYCWHKDLTVVASCRMCLVEIGDKKPDGTIAMQPRVVPGCQTPVKDGSVVVTDSKKAKDAQAGTLEYLLLNHPLDCPVCDQAGECDLQDYSYKYGRGYSRLKDDKLQKADKDHIGANITLYTDRCVMCTRCVRFTREISGTGELQVINRGASAEIDIFPGQPCDNKLAGNVVDLCPVGALCSKDFLYKQRVWFLQDADSVCPGCSTGCSINVASNKNIIYRLTPRTNPDAQGSFMCDDGRFGFKHINAAQRLMSPLVKTGDRHSHVMWDDLLPRLRRELSNSANKHGKGFAVVLSPYLTVEEAYLAAVYFTGLNQNVRLVLGPVPVEGQDDKYPKGPHGEPPAADKVKFTIRKEKCPNLRGVVPVIDHFQDDLVEWDDFIDEVKKGSIKAVYAVGGYPGAWVSPDEVAAMSKLELLVVQDILPSALSTAAKYVLPGGSFAEKSGTFVNFNLLAQGIKQAIVGPGEARPDARIFMELMERRGLFHASTLRAEIAKAIPYFEALGRGDLGEFGVFLGKGKAVGANASTTAAMAGS
ncbi:MAG TPA: molybdopterin-dependent oxidoreductase [Gemmatales bacterium]|nr:molybdopterin-dependent oxidoreductase [Gemmatales bacterium]